MKSLDEYISEVASPFDEIDDDQSQLIQQSYERYQRDVIIDNIYQPKCKHYIHLFLDDYLNSQTKESISVFLNDVLSQLFIKYHLHFLKDYINQNLIIENKPELVVDLLTFLELERWLYDLVPSMPLIDGSIILSKEKIRDTLLKNYDVITEKIIENEKVPFLLKYFAEFCSFDDLISFIFSLIMKDIVGVVSVQLVGRNLN